MRPIEMTGQKFGRLTVIERAPEPTTKQQTGKAYWLCKCDCGKDVIAPGVKLRNERVKSCTCWRYDKLLEASTIHGKSETPEFNVWMKMIARCENERDSNYKDYGARGISVCERWRNSFENFLSDMGERPSPQHSIDRRDNSLGYTPENCRWATALQQQNNRRDNVKVAVFGFVANKSEWCRLMGVSGSYIQCATRSTGRTPEQVIVKRLGAMGIQ